MPTQETLIHNKNFNKIRSITLALNRIGNSTKAFYIWQKLTICHGPLYTWYPSVKNWIASWKF